MPDLATFPLRVYRPAIGHLQARRRVSGATLPTLVIATTDDRRSAWTRLLDEVARSRRGAPLDARIVTWRELLDDRHDLDDVAAAARPTSAVYARDLRLRPLDERRPGSPIPRPVGSVFDRDASDASLGKLALEVSPVERVLLDLVGRHPFLTADSLAAVLGWETRRVRERRARLIRLGLVRLLDIPRAPLVVAVRPDRADRGRSRVRRRAAGPQPRPCRPLQWPGRRRTRAPDGNPPPPGARSGPHARRGCALRRPVSQIRRSAGGERRRDPRVAGRRGVQSAAGTAGRVRHGPSSTGSFTASSWSTTAAR